MTLCAGRRSRSRSTILAAVVLSVASALVTACEGGGRGPTAARAPLVVREAAVTVDGRAVSDATLPRGSLLGESMLLTCRLEALGVPMPGEEVWVDYDGPHARGRMRDRFRLHDDGIGCDPMAWDGRYCYEDHAGEYGPHHGGARVGQYHYEFWGRHQDGRESGRVMVMVTLVE